MVPYEARLPEFEVFDEALSSAHDDSAAADAIAAASLWHAQSIVTTSSNYAHDPLVEHVDQASQVDF